MGYKSSKDFRTRKAPNGLESDWGFRSLQRVGELEKLLVDAVHSEADRPVASFARERSANRRARCLALRRNVIVDLAEREDRTDLRPDDTRVFRPRCIREADAESLQEKRPDEVHRDRVTLDGRVQSHRRVNGAENRASGESLARIHEGVGECAAMVSELAKHGSRRVTAAHSQVTHHPLDERVFVMTREVRRLNLMNEIGHGAASPFERMHPEGAVLLLD